MWKKHIFPKEIVTSELLLYGIYFGLGYLKLQFSSVAQSCRTLCDPMNHSTPGLPVHHKLPEFTQIHAHRVGDAIQPFETWHLGPNNSLWEDAMLDN